MAKTVFAYQPCVGCVKCGPGVKGAARASWIWLLHICTCGVTLLLAAVMKCPRCSHTTFINPHQPTGEAPQVAPTMPARTPQPYPPSVTTPPPSPAAPPTVSPPPSGLSPAQSLRELKALHEEGILTDDEYESKRKGLTDQL